MENNYVLRPPTPGDGSCLAHALVDQMSQDPILRLNSIDHQQFRRLVVNSLPQMISSGFIQWDWEFHDTIGTANQWMEQALVPNSYLDFVFLHVASHVLNRRIRVLHVVGGHILDISPRTTTGNLYFIMFYKIITYTLIQYFRS